ncbi:MAG: type IV toxin-antitoxin system AbiEi family antitoxin domain-containing protein [Caldisericia bacterium]
MKKYEIIKILQKFKKKIFSFSDLKKLLHIENDNYLYIIISRLIKDGILINLKKGIYYLEGSEPSIFEIANILYEPSYISLETALNYYGILIQTPYIIFSVTPKRGKKIILNGKEYLYFHIDKKYFKDYLKEKDFLIATPEKALVDTLYFSSFNKTRIDINELNLEIIDKKKMKHFLNEIQNKTFQKFIRGLEL